MDVQQLEAAVQSKTNGGVFQQPVYFDALPDTGAEQVFAILLMRSHFFFEGFQILLRQSLVGIDLQSALEV